MAKFLKGLQKQNLFSTWAIHKVTKLSPPPINECFVGVNGVWHNGSSAAFGPGDPGSKPCWSAVIDFKSIFV